ncbi:2Fe-2S ferredoxin-type domain-containing protein [Dactylonectria macrodidyma]|uniref:2Fe-2S ferredoxin-type domain-containing protein n=1 Tax=Dactylonectria macrodidyma TaxID=307937 RepID=A0A9P9FL30_9HYPO|nr:2Fe-2S ferredoxin-type domain-containing protein [Dactylonectria macrodidyma]
MSAPRSVATSFARLPAALCRQAQPIRNQSRASLLSTQCSARTQSAILSRIARQTPLATRTFSTSTQRRHGHVHTPKPGEELYITFVEKDGEELKIAVCEGDNLLDIAQANDIEMEGACGGSCACSTCHVIVAEDDYFDKMPEPDDDENDMLDLAFGLTELSRLGCQVKMTKELDGLKVKLPSMTRNLQASDFQ